MQKAIQRNAIDTIRDPNDRRKVLIRYDSLKPRYKGLVHSRYGDPYEYHRQQLALEAQAHVAMAKSSLASNVLIDLAVLTQIKLTKAGGSRLGDRQAHDLAKAAAWMQFLLGARAKDHGFPTKDDMYMAALEEIKREDLHGFSLTSLDWLKKKLTMFKRGGWQSLLSDKYGNKNRAVLGDRELRVIRLLYSDPRKFSIAEVADIYEEIACEQGWKRVTRQAVNAYLAKPEIKSRCSLFRHGRKAWRNAYDPIIHRHAPSFPNDLWVGDGTPWELWYKDGNAAPRRLTVFAFLDACSWKVVGYSVGDRENSLMVFSAMKMACKMSGSMPYEILTDNSSAVKGNGMEKWLGQVAEYVTFAQVGNARAKVVEPFFAHLRNRILRYYSNHSGGNITAKHIDSEVNPDLIASIRDSFPTREEVEAEIHRGIALWNEMEGRAGRGQARRKPNEAHAEVSPRRRELSLEVESELFWVWKAQGIGANARVTPVRYTNAGLSMEVSGVKRRYIAPAGGSEQQQAEFFMDHIGREFRVKYDPMDLGLVMLYDGDRPVAMAEEIATVPMAKADRTDGDAANLDRMMSIKARVERLAREEHAADAEAAADVLKGGVTLERLHKDALNRAQEAIKQLSAVGFIEQPDLPEDLPVRRVLPYDKGRQGQALD